ncbi:glycosyltransferase [Limnohabitans sp. Hippo3]|uniref:MraY family glycosyltransferase n=1 Tax=Limnohabitans sp. Hippo3 TaxID=1597956 RepID=UPI001304D0AE|nr:glycosyltransferase [Limnohabitans sp. Hippo3]
MFAPIAWPLLVGAVSSLVLSLLVVFTTRWHGAFSLDESHGVQKMHAHPTPRIGGLPMLVGLLAAWVASPPDLQQRLTPWLLAGIPAFAFGLAEDFTKRVSVTQRLLATMASGVLAWWLSGYALSRVDIWGFDTLLQWLPFAVMFTAFAVGGVANAINIIDGLNGLASSMVFWALLGLAGVAHSVGDPVLSQTCLLIAACVAGFFFVNWPLGKIFLGDGGSYFLGFSLAWGCVLLIERHANVTAFAALLLCVHPITEVLFSVWRRRQRQQHPGHPDRLHFHSLVKRRVMSRILPHSSRRFRNSVAGLLVGSMSFLPAIMVQFVYQSSVASLACIGLLVAGYVWLYRRIVSA